MWQLGAEPVVRPTIMNHVTDNSAAVDWQAVPGYPRFYQPDVIESGLHRLADAAGVVAAARAASSLDQGGLVHGHSAAVMPAAAVAAPILVGIVEHGHSAAKAGACRLLDESMRYDAIDGYTRVSTSFGSAVPICCAVAHHIHVRRDALRALGPLGRGLLVEADKHWQFTVGAVIDDGPDTVAFGTVTGTVPDGRQIAECHTATKYYSRCTVRLEYPVASCESDAWLRLFDVMPQFVRAHSVLLSAECGVRVH